MEPVSIVYSVRARVYGTLKILVSAPVPFGLIGFYWDLVGVLGLRVWGRSLKIVRSLSQSLIYPPVGITDIFGLILL